MPATLRTAMHPLHRILWSLERALDVFHTPHLPSPTNNLQLAANLHHMPSVLDIPLDFEIWQLYRWDHEIGHNRRLNYISTDQAASANKHLVVDVTAIAATKNC
mmetsp:Transcript_24127/g.33788  ORF Transcript_24127/g.33788 Transcript_24127/m.33788 type:complete len:104 (-) Transcript_24127:192-503(-)